MDNNLREKAEALVKRVHEVANDKIIADKMTVSNCARRLADSTCFRNLEAALRPSREEIADYLAEYNKWRKGGDGPQPEPKELGEYIQYAIEELRRG